MYDVVIVGACTAGTYFAGLLAQRGLKVLVIDRDAEANLAKRLDIIHFTRDSYEEFDVEPSGEGDEEFVRNFHVCYGKSALNNHLKTNYINVAVLHLPLFIDGARLGYALASSASDIKPADLAHLCDVFYIGGTKVGALFGEALVISNPAINRDFRYMIKRHGGMLAKGRLLGLQFMALMENDLYFTIAEKAVAQASRIRDTLLEKNIPMLIDSPTNQLFPIFTAEQLAVLEKDFAFAMWEKVDANRTCMRICTSWATPDEYVDALIDALEAL